LPTFKLPHPIDGADSSAIYEEDADGVPVEPVKEHTDPRTLADCVSAVSCQLLTGCFGPGTMPPDQTPEFRNMLELLRKCLDLRDKYISISNQRLGDNPRDHDGVFRGIAEGISDVMGIRPEATRSYKPMQEQFEPWSIYPPPPPPHWHWTADQAVSSGTQSTCEMFDFSKCEIPGAHGWEFEIDEKGIYQVYHDATGTPFTPLVILLAVQSLFSCR
jgi:AMP deaminase